MSNRNFLTFPVLSLVAESRMETRSGKTLVSTSPQISTEVPTAEATLICETSDTTKEDTGTVSGEESKETEEDGTTELKETLRKLSVQKDGEDVNFHTFLSAYEWCKDNNKVFKLTLKELHALKEKYVGKSKTSKDSTPKITFNSKSWYCKKLDGFLLKKKYKATCEEALQSTIGGRWSNERDGYRLCFAVHQHHELLLTSFKGRTKSEIDDPTSVCTLDEYYTKVQVTFNDEKWNMPTKVPLGSDASAADKVNCTCIEEDLKRSNKKCIHLSLKQVVSHVKRLEQSYIQISSNIDKSGTHDQDPSGFFQSHVDMLFFYLKATLPDADRKVSHGILLYTIDTSHDITPLSRRRNKRSKRKRDDDRDLLWALLEQNTRQFGAHQQNQQKSKSEIVRELRDA